MKPVILAAMTGEALLERFPDAAGLDPDGFYTLTALEHDPNGTDCILCAEAVYAVEKAEEDIRLGQCTVCDCDDAVSDFFNSIREGGDD